MPARILKGDSEKLYEAFQNLYNSGLSKATKGHFAWRNESQRYKFALGSFARKDYQPITVLLPVSKIYERLMQNQVYLLSKVSRPHFFVGFQM